jgi:hypothetical protein
MPTINPPTIVQTDLAPTASNSFAGSSTADIPLGSFVLVAVNIGNNNNAPFVSLVDSTGLNTYTPIQPAANASCTSNAFFYCLNTSADIPIGSSWKAVTSGAVFWNMKRVVYTNGVLAGVDGNVTLAQPVAATTTNLTIAPAFSNEIAFGYLYVNGNTAGGGTISSPGSPWVNVLNNGYNDFSYILQPGSFSNIVYNPTWTSSQAYDAINASFFVQPPPLPPYAECEW